MKYLKRTFLIMWSNNLKYVLRNKEIDIKKTKKKYYIN